MSGKKKTDNARAAIKAEEKMRIDPFLYHYFLVYARDLREEFPGQTIRNAAVVKYCPCRNLRGGH